MKKLIFILTLLLGSLSTQAEDNFIGPDSLCSVTIDTVQNGFCGLAFPTGTAPFTYMWSDSTFESSTCFNLAIDYCVTVTDATGCVAVACVGNPNPSCSVWLDVQQVSFGNSFTVFTNPSGTAPYTYVWGNGETDSDLYINSSGTYCVTITDAVGCVTSECVDFVLPPACEVSVYQDTSNNCFQANPGGEAPFTYLWSTGETTEIACTTIPAWDTICVTITDATGCVVTACEAFNPIASCPVEITQNGTALSVTSSNPAQQYTYSWSTGETTPSISPTLAGTYCVTVTEASGCVNSACITYLVSDEVSGYIIYDSTIFVNSGFNDFMVYLIEHDVPAGTLTAIDSQLITGTPNYAGIVPYAFSNVADGDYLLKAAIQVGSDDYDNFMPTYLGSVLFWNESTTVTVPQTNNFNNIHMIMGDNPGGPGFIGGLISEGANLVSTQVEIRGEGDPIANVNVLLLNANDEPVLHTVTDENGEFAFSNLAWGTYQVIVEVLGKEKGEQMITIGEDNPSVMTNFDVNENTITEIEEVLNGASLKIFPNPVTDRMNVQVEIRKNVELNISVINLLGKTMIADRQQMNEGIQTMQINMEALPAGIYFLNLSDGQNMISRKIMK